MVGIIFGLLASIALAVIDAHEGGARRRSAH
jgi:hypothetical protein